MKCQPSTDTSKLKGNKEINSVNGILRVKRKGCLQSFVESCVCYWVCIGVSFEQKHAV